MSTKSRFYQIDLFRFIAALGVVLYHYVFRGWAADGLSQITFPRLGQIFKYGYLGVDLFFLISGFVILLSIQHGSISKFISSRFARLYPSYCLCLTLTYAVISIYGAPTFEADFLQYLFNLTMFQNYFGVKSINGVYWTLFVEMKFYIFIIGLYLTLAKKRDIAIESILAIWLLLSFLYIPFQSLLVFKILNYFLVLEWASYFSAGMVCFQISKAGFSAKYIGFLVLSFTLSLYYAFKKMKVLETVFSMSFSPFIVGILIFIFYCAMLLVVTKKLKIMNSPHLIKVGMLTYPLYLIHENIGYIILQHLGGLFNKYLLISIVIIMMVICSYILSIFYEPTASLFFKRRIEYIINYCKLKLRSLRIQ